MCKNISYIFSVNTILFVINGVILLQWDPDSIYKNNPAILIGGYEQFLDTYPTFTTNPKVKCPLEHTSSSFIHLSKYLIQRKYN